MIRTDSAYITNPVTLKWSVGSCPDQFPLYEVNVLRLKNKSAAYRDNPNKLKDTVHWEKAQRLFAYGYTDRMTLTLAEGTGYYVWRVRPIGNYYAGGMANDSNWGCWSISANENDIIDFAGTDSVANVSSWRSGATGRGVSMFYYKQFDADKNWQFGRVFVEGKDGRSGIAENMTYATSLLLPVQKQSPVPSTGRTLIQQTIPDYYGRPVMSTLGATRNDSIKAYPRLEYATAFAKKDTLLYRASHFDVTSKVLAPDTMSGRVGTYWSSSNSDLSIPSANGYPFTRTLYGSDPLGRVTIQSAAGSYHRIGTANTVRTLYGPTTERELVTMFGSEAPTDSSVSRIFTTDQNGVTSLTYQRMDGKTIATCLIKGDGNSLLFPLNDSSVINTVSLSDTVRRGTNTEQQRIVAQRTILITDTTSVTFNYFIESNQLQLECSSYCKTCDYNVYIKVTNVDSTTPTYYDSVLVNAGNCTSSVTGTKGPTSKTLLPGTYIMERTLQPRTSTPWLSLHTSQIVSEHKSKVQKLLKNMFSVGADSVDLDSFRLGKHYTNELIARRMLTQYKKYRRDSAASNGYMATVDTCCQVYLDSALCKTGCETDSAERPRYEQMLIDRWKDSVSAHDSLSGSGLYLDAYIYDYNGMTLLDSLGGSFPHGSGVIDSLIRTMIDSGGYDCSKIYDCWSSLVDGYWYMAWESDSTGARRKPGVNILDMFLDCVGTKYCSTAPRSERVTGAAWLLNAWKVLPSATLDSITAECTEMLNVDSTWTCNGSNDVEIDIKYQQLRACQSGSTIRYTYPNYSRDIYNKAKADSTNPYFVTLPEGVSKDTVNKIYQKMITECQSLCEQRRNRVRDSLVYMYVKNGSRVEGYYQLGPDSAIVDTIKTYQLACIVDLIVADCMDSCYFNIEWGLDTNGQDSLIHPTADELKRYNNTFMANSFRVKPAATGEVPCSGVGWHHINRKVVLADYLAEILNQKLKTHRDSMPAGVERWNILPILEELAAEYPPLSVCYPPTDTVSNPADSANANVQAFSVWTVMVDKSKESRFIVRRDSGVCSLEYEPPTVTETVQLYTPENPHPLVGILNRYLRATWAKTIPLSDTALYNVVNKYETNYIDSVDFFTYYKVGSLDPYKWADTNDPYRPPFSACDTNGVLNSEASWDYCPDPIACINGNDITMAELRQIFKIRSSVQAIVKHHPTDTTAKIYGWHIFSGCDKKVAQLLDAPHADDSTISFVWNESNFAIGAKYKMDSAQSQFSKFNSGYTYADSVGRFVQTADGKLGFINFIDSNRTVIFDCIDFSCARRISDSCNKIPMCNICDTVDCGSICFKWVDADTIAPTTSMKPKSCVVSEIDRLYHAIEGTLLNDCLARKIKNVEISYNATCFDPNRIKDRFTATRGESYYHYTLYYYDRSGNLVKTVPPSGFRPLTSGQTRSTTPSHVMVTKYDYNTLGQLVKQSTPDGGQTEFYYDGKGRLRLSHNARQASTTFSYTDYDALGRIIEVGEATGISSPDTHAKTVASTSGGTFRVITTYTTPASSIPSPWAARTQRYLRNRVSYVKSDEDGDLGTLGDQVITYYSYDPHGNVEWLVQSIPGLYGGMSQEGIAIDYDYDLMSGKVRKVVMQKGRYDQSMHRYEYDYDGRLTKVETSRDGWIWDRDAAYAYYPHGPLKRMELGHDLIQGIDYAYTINGWLKGMNTPKLDVAYDMGGDGYSSSANKRYGRDAFGMFLRYHDQDFKHTGSVLDQSGAISSWHQSGGDLFNGNISAWSINTRKPSGNGDSAIGSRYHYDVLNRIRTDSTQERSGGAWGTPSMKFGSTYTYDGNGNIKTLSRNETSGGFDNLEYHYITGTNKLSYIHDYISPLSESVTGDLASNDTNNYVYDATGNLTQDTSEHIGANGIVWTPMNKIRSITKSGSAQKIEYLYDAMGNRVRKQVYEPSTTLKSTTWYVRDPKGTVMATYTKTGSDTLRLTEIPIYGSERIGMMTPNVAYKSAAIDTMDATFTRELGKRLYELKDHLGNVRATVSDLLIDHSGSKDAELVASTDYYPFGMIIPSRSYMASGSTAYRYGFNGQERSDEISGGGNHNTAEYWEYDTRVARRWNIDPKPNVSVSVYAAFEGNPIVYSDPMGDTVRGQDESSGARAVEGIRGSFTGPSTGSVRQMFKLEPDGKTLAHIDPETFNRAVSGLTVDQQQLAYGYMQAVNGTALHIVEVVSRSETLSGASQQAFKAHHLHTGEDVNMLAGGGVNAGQFNSQGQLVGTRTVVVLDATFLVPDYQFSNSLVTESHSSSLGELLSHELLGHGLGRVRGSQHASHQDALQMTNLFLRTQGVTSLYRNGASHGDRQLLSMQDATGVPNYLLMGISLQLNVAKYWMPSLAPVQRDKTAVNQR
ncbi:MAG: RHS repeat protein [Bacteroidetes bacterium]|nr:RHS repeat protein [Bacteroidota bacterium]